jgi:hypothetical protein
VTGAGGEATRPVDPARRSLKTEQRATKGSSPSLLEPDLRPMHRAEVEQLRHVCRRIVYAAASQRHDNSLVTCVPRHVTLFTESLILAQDERWRRA